MLEFIQLCFSPINLPFTLLMICMFGYWGMFFIGAVGLDVLDDLDLDLEGDVDVDLDLDVDADIDVGDVDVDVDPDLDVDADADLDHGDTASGSRSGWFVSLLKFMDVGDVPLMILLSALVFSIWSTSLVVTKYFNPAQSLMWAVAWFLPDFIFSLLLTKVLTFPAGVLFRKANSGIEKRTKIIGRTCVVTTSRVTDKMGQAEIRVDDAAPITLNVRCRSGEERKPLKKGDEALILELVEEKGTYTVVPFDLEVS